MLIKICYDLILNEIIMNIKLDKKIHLTLGFKKMLIAVAFCTLSPFLSYVLIYLSVLLAEYIWKLFI